MNERGAFLERRFDVGDRRQRLIADLHSFARILGCGLAGANHDGNRLTQVAHRVRSDRILCGRLLVGYEPNRYRKWGLESRHDVFAGQDCHHPIRLARSSHIDAEDPRVGVLATYDEHMEHTGRPDTRYGLPLLRPGETVEAD